MMNHNQAKMIAAILWREAAILRTIGTHFQGRTYPDAESLDFAAMALGRVHGFEYSTDLEENTPEPRGWEEVP